MAANIKAYSEEKIKQRYRRRRAAFASFALAILAVAGVSWLMRLIGFTKSADTTCGLQEHTHTSECFVRVLDCDKDEEHGDDCYKHVFNCDGTGKEIPEHTHSITCYSDDKADIETSSVWEKTIPTLSGNISSDIVAVAKSQIGNTESIQNYILDENGNIKGITRYGQWYGNPYGTWDAMFVSFCLNYAGVGRDVFPYNSGAFAWSAALKTKDLFVYAQNCTTVRAGDIAFFDISGDGSIDKVAIITGSNGDVITVIEGDRGNAVAYAEYSLHDKTFMGTASPASAVASYNSLWANMTDEQKVEYVIADIDNLPDIDEIETRLNELELLGNDEEYGNYHNQVTGEIFSSLLDYENLDDELKDRVSNAEELKELAEKYDVKVSTYEVQATAKAPKHNNVTVETEVVDTRDFIELNLYDYGDNINTPYLTKSTYPGFKNPGGALTGAISRWGLGFGDNITADIKAGLPSFDSPVSVINEVFSPASGSSVQNSNLPTSIIEPTAGNFEHRQVLSWTLNEAGYPALPNGDSLAYLFSETQLYGQLYAHKMNKNSITGLFKYDPQNGIYSYNSLENHAQYVGEDRFVLYKERITPNIIVYPFGNFLPFNDIVDWAQRGDSFNAAYINTLVSSLANKTKNDSDYSGSDNLSKRKTPYATLKSALSDFISRANSAFGTGWGIMDVLQEYFSINTSLTKDPIYLQESLKTLYNIDYDEPTDFYFGMEMKMNFVQSPGGVNSKNKATILRFAGDDDVMFYIDGVLFLDLSGIHRHVGGTIDFQRGIVSYYALDPNTESGDIDFEKDTPVFTETFDQILRRAGKTVQADALVKGTFADYSSHTLNWYYMERGSGSGVCRIEFNLEQVTPSGIYKVSQYGDAIQGAGFAIYPAEKVNNTYVYKFGDGVKTSAEVVSVDPDTGTIVFNDNSTLTPEYVGLTEEDGSMVFAKSDGQIMSMSDMRNTFGDHFILREIKIPPGYRAVAKESWLTFSVNTLLCENTLESGTWAAPNVLVMASERLHPANNPSETIQYYSRTSGNGDVQNIQGTLFAVVMRKSDDDPGNTNLSSWHPVIGSDFTRYEVLPDNGVTSAIAAAKTYVHPDSGKYTHVFDVGLMYDPESTEKLQVGMVVTVEELPGEPEMYYPNVLAQYLLDHPDDDDGAADYALRHSKYAVVYYYTTAASLDGANASNTRRIVSRTLEDSHAVDFQVMWSSTVQVPNIVNTLYFQKTDIAGNLINDAVFGLYPAVKGSAEKSDGYYKADLKNGTQYYVRLDQDDSDLTLDAIVYNRSFNIVGNGTYSIDMAGATLTDDLDHGLITKSGAGVIHVTAGSLTLDITPALNANGERMVGVTHDNCDFVSSPGTGHFSYLLYSDDDPEVGRYFVKELKAPDGYALSRDNVKVVVRPNAVYASAGTVDDHVTVGNGPGYLVKTLDNFATKGAIADSLAWIYGLLRVENSDDFLDYIEWNKYIIDDVDDGIKHIGSGTALTPNNNPYDGTTAMVQYYEFDTEIDEYDRFVKLFDFKRNDRSEWENEALDDTPDNAVPGIQKSLFLWTQSGWSDMAIYQDSVYGSRVSLLYPNSTFNSIGTREITNLFSSSTVVRVADDGLTKIKLVKEDMDEPEIKLQGAKFVLSMLDDGDSIWEGINTLYYDDAQGKFRLMLPDETLDTFALTTDETGMFELKEPLAPGEYTLTEVKAPDGYHILTYSINITVSVNSEHKNVLTAKRSDNDATLEVDATPTDNPIMFVIHVQNTRGYELPATGGEGVIGIYALGWLFILASLVYGVSGLVRRRKEAN